MLRPRLIAAAVTASLIGGLAGMALWLDRPQPLPPDLEREYWQGVAMVERTDAPLKAAEKNCRGTVEIASHLTVRCKRR